METQFRCLTCYEKLSNNGDYLAHRNRGHVTVEYINYKNKSDCPHGMGLTGSCLLCTKKVVK